MFKSLFFISIIGSFWATSPAALRANQVERKEGMLKITFENVVNKEPMILRTVNYTNPFEEGYVINKFKYYVSNIMLKSSAGLFVENNSYHLINQEDPVSLSFSFAMPAGNYTSLLFLLGVDSLHNVSGAQTDALDPINDMFWTWNSGYVMAKMEGTSPSSPLNNKFEFHLGGFSGVNSVLQNISIGLLPATLVIRENETSQIIIRADADMWWQHPNNVTIAGTPNITSPGLPAKKISENYRKMFTIKQIINP